MSALSPKLGDVVARLRKRRNWTLKQMSEASGLSPSTLAKVEHDRLTLTYEKLQRLSECLGIRMADMFADDAAISSVTARRSLGRVEDAVQIVTANYDNHYLCAELRQKRMIPVISRIRARTLSDFGGWVSHAGEEFIFVIEGAITVETEYYEPVTLERGQSIYIDSRMGHAYLVAAGCDEALVLAVMSSGDVALLGSDPTVTNFDLAGGSAAMEKGPRTPRGR